MGWRREGGRDVEREKEVILWEEGEGEKGGGIIMHKCSQLFMWFHFQTVCLQRSRSGNILLQFGSWYLQSLIHYVSGNIDIISYLKSTFNCVYILILANLALRLKSLNIEYAITYICVEYASRISV